MHLKTLTMKGFKSFASATTLRLEPGITAVVGPNGSGKSNVVDALTWVMGEQGAKNLRGGSMADVIFAGAGSRPALGRAEVSLTIDNSDGALPIDYTEVTVTRTLFRGGGSEYQINGSPARLLDVQELLSDTGLGKQMHVIVGQGRLDAVLQATPEERRGFIEEAAGVLKHRRRKERALRKLEGMKADLARLNDLTAELRRQLGPLARQAAAARKAHTIQAELRDATARLLADDVVTLQATLHDGEEERALLAERQAQAREAEQEARARLAAISERDATAAARLTQATRAWEELSSVTQGFQSLTEVAGERLRSLSRPAASNHGTDPEELERRAAAAAAQEAELDEAIENARSALTRVSEERADAEAEDAAASTALEALSRQDAERRETLARAGGQVASARSRDEAARAALRSAEEAAAAAQKRVAEAQRALDEDESARAKQGAGALTGALARGGASADEGAADQGRGAAADAGAADGAVPGVVPEHATSEAERPASPQALAAQAHEAAAAALAQARVAVTEAGDRRREAAAERARWEARAEALSLSLVASDATGELAASGREGVFGSVGELLRIERGWENALAALLGDLATAALVADEEAALGFIEGAEASALRLAYARLELESVAEGDAAQSAAGATDVVEAGGDVRESGDEAREEVGQAATSRINPPDGVAIKGAHRVLDLLRIDAPAQALLAHLLHGAWVAEDLETAQGVRDAAPGATVATRSGELLAPDRLVTRGDASASVLEIAAAHEDALAQARAAGEAEQKAAEAFARAEQTESAAREHSRETLNALRQADAEAAEIAQRRAQLSSTLRAAQEEEQRARRVVERAREETAQRAEALNTALAALAALESQGGQESLRTEALEQARARKHAAEEAARVARQAETEARLTLRTQEERARGQQGRAESLCAAARREREQRAAAQRAEERRLGSVSQVSAVRDMAQQAWEQSRDWVEEAAEQRRAVEAEREDAITAMAQIREQIDDAARALAELSEAVHRDELARAEQQLRLEALAERAMKELGLTLEQLVEEYGPHLLIPEVPAEPESGKPYVRAEQEARLAKATKALARLGKVNPLALEEHAAMEERHDFLAQQLADLTASRQDLLQIVEEIDARVLEVFTAAYQDTAAAFEEVFDRLFPGGHGRLSLTDPDDMLNTGIEIEARPAGKKVTRLSLLSGGERSLAAVALLIAIFKARPSPFYVMDEVEAALDDTNLGRLLDIFTELRESSQLIVITHQKRTMEVADALYGITMRDGVTQVVSQRLEWDADEA